LYRPSKAAFSLPYWNLFSL